MIQSQDQIRITSFQSMNADAKNIREMYGEVIVSVVARFNVNYFNGEIVREHIEKRIQWEIDQAHTPAIPRITITEPVTQSIHERGTWYVMHYMTRVFIR